MVLANYTEAEINQLRHVCSRPDAKIKYLALAFTRVEHSTSKIVKIVAQAYDKLSAPVWREQLGCRIREVKSAGNLKQVVDAIRNGGVLWRHGIHRVRLVWQTGAQEDRDEAQNAGGLHGG